MPQLIFTREQVRQVDKDAVEQYGIPSIVLMENAARQVADKAQAMLDATKRVLVLCGGGNNGGDGLAAARHLQNRGIDVTVVLVKSADKYKDDAGANLDICRKMDLKMIDAADDPVGVLQDLDQHDLILDGLLGTGIDSEIRSPMDRVIEWVNQRNERVLAIDIPSGLDCDRGIPLGNAVQANATITFVGMKAGFIKTGADRYTGVIEIADIGAPRQLTEKYGKQ
jgi:NAD(P)H-hydrate epimerase